MKITVGPRTGTVVALAAGLFVIALLGMTLAGHRLTVLDRYGAEDRAGEAAARIFEMAGRRFGSVERVGARWHRFVAEDVVDIDDKRAVAAALRIELDTNDWLSGLIVADTEGGAAGAGALADTEAKTDPRSNRWFFDALDRRGTSWSVESSGVWTMSRPLYRSDGSLAGVIAIEFSPALPFDDTAVALLLDSHGQFVSSLVKRSDPDSDESLIRAIVSQSNPVQTDSRFRVGQVEYLRFEERLGADSDVRTLEQTHTRAFAAPPYTVLVAVPVPWTIPGLRTLSTGWNRVDTLLAAGLVLTIAGCLAGIMMMTRRERRDRPTNIVGGVCHVPGILGEAWSALEAVAGGSPGTVSCEGNGPWVSSVEPARIRELLYRAMYHAYDERGEDSGISVNFSSRASRRPGGGSVVVVVTANYRQEDAQRSDAFARLETCAERFGVGLRRSIQQQPPTGGRQIIALEFPG